MLKKRAWIRVLRVRFTSTLVKRELVFGTSIDNKKKNFLEPNIEIEGYKYMSCLKDSCTIKISNLQYSDIVRLIQGQYYNVSIEAGYRDGNVNKIFDGGVLYISNTLGDNKTHTAIILCASKLIAQYSQKRLNLTLNSGINLYSAIKFVCKVAGIPESNVSTEFKRKFLQDVSNVNTTCGSWIEQLCNNNSFIANSDSIASSTFSIFDAAKNNKLINLESSTVDLTGGYPRLTSDGLKLTIMPTMSLMCGDVIKLDNSIIDISVTNSKAANKNYAAYLDKDGCYLIKEQEFRLENRGSSFSIELICMARSLLSNLTTV